MHLRRTTNIIQHYIVVVVVVVVLLSFYQIILLFCLSVSTLWVSWYLQEISLNINSGCSWNRRSVEIRGTELKPVIWLAFAEMAAVPQGGCSHSYGQHAHAQHARHSHLSLKSDSLLSHGRPTQPRYKEPRLVWASA